jgi:hypothetical protein
LVENKERMFAIHELARKSIQASAGMQQRSQKRGGLKMTEFKVGQEVWGLTHALPTENSSNRGQDRRKSLRWLRRNILLE